MESIFKEELKKRFEMEYPKKTDKDINEMNDDLEMCLNPKFRYLFTVCRTYDDIDVSILKALLQVGKKKDAKSNNEQLKLALKWNRPDIARDYIFTDELKDQVISSHFDLNCK